MSESKDHARLLSPDEIDGLDSEGQQHDSFERRQVDDDSTAARLREYEGSAAYEKSGAPSSIMARLSPKTVKNLIIGVGLALLLILVATMLPGKKVSKVQIVNMLQPGKMTSEGVYKIDKPKGTKIVGVIFYGRAKFVDILDCYLRKNLAVNGGLLDEVVFMENTNKQPDIEYAKELVAKVPQYTLTKNSHWSGNGYDAIWPKLTEDNTIYLKMDDDLVWMDDSAVARMVETLIAHPEAHDVAGNIINSPLTNWQHHHNGAVYPYLPETHPPAEKVELADWRPSKLPLYNGELTEEYNFEPNANKPDAHFQIGDAGGPPFEGHRWLPLNNTSENLLRTPIAKSEWNAFGRAWTSWAIGAQQLASLFDNLEKGSVARYWFGSGEDGIFNPHYERYNLNFLAIRGESVKMEFPGVDDEQDLTVTIPKKFHRPCLIQTRALVAHFNFAPQQEIGHTDLLDRFRLYANEHVCTADNQKKPFPSS